MISRVKMIQYGGAFWSWIIRIFGKISKELVSPRKPTWVLIFMTAANVAVIMMVGWNKFFRFFDGNPVFLIGSQFSVFVIITALAYKDKKKGNVDKMNWMASAFILFLAIGFIFGHDGVRSWAKERDIEAANAAPAPQKISGAVTGNRVVVTAPVGENSRFIPIPDNTRFFLQSEGGLRVTAITADGKTYVFTIGANDTLYLKDAVDVRKLSFSSEESSPQEVVLRLFKKI